MTKQTQPVVPDNVPTLSQLQTFGDIAAEDDAVLNYFLATDAVSTIAEGKVFLVLGRKGSGKTALVRHFTEGAQGISRAVSLKSYPWLVHADRIDSGASDVEAYVASWRYFIAVTLASLAIKHAGTDNSKPTASIRTFFNDNYGGVQPDLGDLLRPSKLKLSKLSFEPQVLGNKLGGIALERKDSGLGRDLEALTRLLLDSVKELAARLSLPGLSLHFDELDHGLSTLDAKRRSMLTGLMLAIRSIRAELRDAKPPITVFVYLRTDLWDELTFSDKNKITQSYTLDLKWDRDTLKDLVDERLRAKLGKAVKWETISSAALMRGSQTKWDHVLARTFLRPRDVISFLNSVLQQAKKRASEPLVIENEDVVNARDTYSLYLKKELDDEVGPHWAGWEDALRACSAMATITFERDQFITTYEKKKNAANPIGAEEALQLLYNFSVIGYEKRSGYGGSAWVFQYTDPEAGWDSSATRLKVHLGLKEYAKLREERTQ